MPQPLDHFPVETVDGSSRTQQRAATGLDSERQHVAACLAASVAAAAFVAVAVGVGLSGDDERPDRHDDSTQLVEIENEHPVRRDAGPAGAGCRELATSRSARGPDDGAGSTP